MVEDPESFQRSGGRVYSDPQNRRSEKPKLREHRTANRRTAESRQRRDRTAEVVIRLDGLRLSVLVYSFFGSSPLRFCGSFGLFSLSGLFGPTLQTSVIRWSTSFQSSVVGYQS